MDEYNREFKGGWQNAGICTLITAVIFALALFAVATTFTVCLGLFAFMNPNGDGWYGKIGDVEYMKLKEEWDAQSAGTVVTDLDPVHDLFLIWFTWGFINSCGTKVAMMLMFCIPCCLPVLGCFQCSSLAWWITGMVWRFRESSVFASGGNIPENVTKEQWIEEI